MKATKSYGLAHLAVAVRDLKRTRQFYQSVFEMKVMYHEQDYEKL